MSAVFLIGMPGSGKSFWAEVLGEAYSLPAYDLDRLVSAREGASVTSIFETKGEAYFRDAEHQVLKELLTEGTFVLGCGGGTPCFRDNLQLMKSAGCVIYLRAPIAVLVRRLEHDHHRPLLLRVENIPSYLEEILEARRRYYEQAHYILDTESLSLSTFEEIIDTCIKRH